MCSHCDGGRTADVAHGLCRWGAGCLGFADGPHEIGFQQHAVSQVTVRHSQIFLYLFISSLLIFFGIAMALGAVEP